MSSIPSSISTGSDALDAMFGCGGLPRGRVVELFGSSGCGKTTLSLLWIASAQRQGLNAVFVDLERSLDPDWAVACGARLEDLIVLSPVSAEEGTAMMESLLTSFGVDLLVVDSAAALVSESELATPVEDLPMDSHTELLARCLRRLSMLALRSSACLLILNQTRRDRNGQERSAGYRALALHAAVRVALNVEQRSGTAQTLKLSTIKNKLAAPFAEGWVELRGPALYDVERKGPERAWRAAAATRRLG
ncbi:MAG: ATPase domain-containing protein [Bryobacteraceae bacterium]|nr:ATPase domain-containing protein [Bryobacteraceae bacterium]